MVDLLSQTGYAEIEAASLLAPDSEAWGPFMRDVVKLPPVMLPGVHYAVKAKMWKRAHDPLEQVKRSARNWKGRQDLSSLVGPLALPRILVHWVAPIPFERRQQTADRVESAIRS